MRSAHIQGNWAGRDGRSKARIRRYVRSIPNREREVALTRPDQVWVGDVTYLKVRGQWRYRAVVMDKYSRRILGWSLDRVRDVTLTRATLFHALRKRDPSPGLVFHSDRGMEYGAPGYREIMKRRRFVQSMNQPCRMNDNAHMESFFPTMKAEYIHGKTFDTEADLRRTLKTYFAFYNYDRIHTAAGRTSPARFESIGANCSGVN